MSRLLSLSVRHPLRWRDLDLLATAAEGCWVVDHDLMTVYANRALCGMLGYAETEMPGTHLLSFIADENRAGIERMVALRGLGVQRTWDVTLLRSDGEKLYCLFTASATPQEANGSAGICIFVTDITQRHNQERISALQNEQMREMVFRMTGFFEHLCTEIRDPLTAMLGAAELMAAESGDRQSGDHRAGETMGAGGESGAALLADAGRQVLATFENLQFWTRLQLNQVRLEPRPLEIGGLLQDVLEEMTTKAEARGIVIVCTVFELPAFGDVSAVSFILRTLLDNAIRFSPNEVPVHIAGHLHNGVVRLRILDQGVGIAPEQVTRLFTFGHGVASVGEDGRLGGGLGLLLCKALLDRMDGSITLDSRPGHGTMVTVTLPAPPPAVSAPKPSPTVFPTLSVALPPPPAL